MIYLFHGDDFQKKNKSYDDFISSVDGEIIFIERNNFSPVEIESLHKSSGLFAQKFNIVLKNILDKEEIADFLLERLEDIAISANNFIFVESKLKKDVLDLFKRSKAQIYNFDLKNIKKENFNSFLLANAFGDRDKLKLWIYFRQAREKDVSLEELVGVLFWKAKDMILKKNFLKFKKEELQNIAKNLSYLLPKARREGKDDEACFEQYLLEIF